MKLLSFNFVKFVLNFNFESCIKCKIRQRVLKLALVFIVLLFSFSYTHVGVHVYVCVCAVCMPEDSQQLSLRFDKRRSYKRNCKNNLKEINHNNPSCVDSQGEKFTRNRKLFRKSNYIGAKRNSKKMCNKAKT